MNDFNIEALETKVKKFGEELSNSQAILQELLDDAEDGGNGTGFQDETPENRARMLQLILQYRLDTQDILAKLFQFDNGVMQLLGISPHQSSSINMERLRYALGRDDLNHILHALSLLMDSLLLMTNRYQEKNKLSRQPMKRVLVASPLFKKVYQGLEKALEQQKLALALLLTINHALAELRNTEAISPIYDHIAALRGPITLFFQAIHHGMQLSYALYENLNQDAKLENTISSILEQVNLVLKQPAPVPAPMMLMRPARSLAPETNAERLEQRAAAKRLGCFFNR